MLTFYNDQALKDRVLAAFERGLRNGSLERGIYFRKDDVCGGKGCAIGHLVYGATDFDVEETYFEANGVASASALTGLPYHFVSFLEAVFEGCMLGCHCSVQTAGERCLEVLRAVPVGVELDDSFFAEVTTERFDEALALVRGELEDALEQQTEEALTAHKELVRA